MSTLRSLFQPDKYWTLKINHHENDLQFNALRSRTREAHITLQHGRLFSVSMTLSQFHALCSL